MVESVPDDVIALASAHRRALLGHCYRLLGSPFEAEDAVQETFVRAWSHRDRYDRDRGGLQGWLFAIATNVCLDMLRGRQRRTRAMDLAPASQAGSALGEPLPERAWVLPMPDARVLAAGDDPSALVVEREHLRLAFIVALQLLPPRQRAVLLLRDVLCFSAAEAADHLGTTVAAVNSALQRARAVMRDSDDPPEVLRPDDGVQSDLLIRYCDAFARQDVDAMLTVIHEDATMEMPPFAWWLRGRREITTALRAPDGSCAGARLVPCAVNGSPAFWQTRPSGPGGSHEPFGLVVLGMIQGRIISITNFLDAARLLPLFDRFDADESSVAASYS
jgi:RNA polymerase sigma-70 factor (ECF subfamily)